MEAQTTSGTRIELDTLKPGAEVRGRIVKIGKVGAILNVGGFPALLHISELTGPKARNAPELREGDETTVWVSEVDRDKRRMLVTRFRPPQRPMASLQVGAIVHGKVVRLTKFGAFIDIGAEKDGLAHVSELAHTRVADPSDVLSVGDEVDVKILSIDSEKGQISLSLKAVEPEPAVVARQAEGSAPPSPMQHAWQEALEESSRRTRPPKKHRRERERGMPRGEERDDLFLRTIRYRS